MTLKVEDEMNSYICNISTFGAQNCYGTGNIYKNKSHLKFFRVIQYVSEQGKSERWDLNLKQIAEIEKKKRDRFDTFIDSFSDSVVNKPEISDVLSQELQQ